ncbi:MAG: helix-turn-helix domain-containing protein [Actinobacteria bacterium]|nr:helix-turn-helix domain-containing protein [Actinomycetota bacterium]
MTQKYTPPAAEEKAGAPDSARTSPPLLSTSELATFLGVPVATIYAWRQKGYGPKGIRIGRHVRYRKEDVDTWLRRQEDAEPVSLSGS